MDEILMILQIISAVAALVLFPIWKNMHSISKATNELKVNIAENYVKKADLLKHEDDNNRRFDKFEERFGSEIGKVYKKIDERTIGGNK